MGSGSYFNLRLELKYTLRSIGILIQEADDSDVTEEGVIIRFREGRIVGLTVLNASKRMPQVTGKAKAKA